MIMAFSKITGPMKVIFMWSLNAEWEQFFARNLARVLNMTAMLTNAQKKRWADFHETLHVISGTPAHCSSNDGPRMTFTNFMARSVLET